MPTIEQALTVEWVTGFVEGEGCFSGATHQDYKAKYFAPFFSVTQKDVAILASVAKFFEVNGILGTLYIPTVIDQLSGRPKTPSFRVQGVFACKKVYELLRPHMHVETKINQIESWFSRFGHREGRAY